MTGTISSGRPINGTGQDDELFGDGVANELNGHRGNDMLLGWGVTYDANAMWISETPGFAADEFLRGGVGNDTMAGGGGNDVLDGGTGNDNMLGGSGADLFIHSAGFDTIGDFSAGDGDRIDIPDGTDIAALIAGATPSQLPYVPGTWLWFPDGGGVMLAWVAPQDLQAGWFI